MRKLVVSEFVSLDGVMEDPGGGAGSEYGGWTFRFERGPEGDRFKFEELAAADALLLGRVTYEAFAAVWPQMEEQTGDYGAWMNGYPKHVVSTTLEEPLEWKNSTLIRGNVAGEVSRLKQQEGKDILVFGSADLVNTLMRHDLVDEFRLMVFPIVIGAGRKLFDEDAKNKALRFVETQTFSDGVIALTYQARRGE